MLRAFFHATNLMTLRHALGIHGNYLILNVLADAGLVLLDELRLKFAFAITGD